MEALHADRRATPWLGRAGFVVSGVVYGFGVALVTFGTWKKEQFTAAPTQLAVAAAVAVIFVLLAFVTFPVRDKARHRGHDRRTGTSPWVCGVIAFVAGSVFHLIAQFGSGFLTPPLATVLALALPAALIALVYPTCRMGTWTAAHTDALILGGLLAYCWLGFFLVACLHGPAAIPGQIFPCAVVLGLVYWRFIRGRFA